MAGYLINLDSVEALQRYVATGVFATRIRPPDGFWRPAHEGTFADYASMKPGDHVYFFLDRVIYGVGALTTVGGACCHQNYPGATSRPEDVAYPAVRANLLLDEGPDSANQRWVMNFRPFPRFFTRGVDMDDLLSFRPAALRMIRAFWRRSMIKVDDDEDAAIRDRVLLANRAELPRPRAGAAFADTHGAVHRDLLRRLTPLHRLDPADMVRLCVDGPRVRHEMAIEAALVGQLAAREAQTVAVFGTWDYVTHQLTASPPKPPEYNDWIDVFGYSRLPGQPTIGTYHVVEVKRATATGFDVEQLMKYVDWVRDEYCFGDYGPIRAYLVAHQFAADAPLAVARVARRMFTVGRRPAQTREWGAGGEFGLVGYEAEPTGVVRFRRV